MQQRTPDLLVLLAVVSVLQGMPMPACIVDFQPIYGYVYILLPFHHQSTFEV